MDFFMEDVLLLLEKSLEELVGKSVEEIPVKIFRVITGGGSFRVLKDCTVNFSKNPLKYR